MKTKTRNYVVNAVAIAIIIGAIFYIGGATRAVKKSTSSILQSPANQSAENIPVNQPISKSNMDLLLPDLQVAPLINPHIIVSGNSKTLRFPGTFINAGQGPLELLGLPDMASRVVRAIQYVYKKDGSKLNQEVGNFVFHDNHGHWHFENFVEFELYSLKNGSELDQKISGTGKITFCIHDFAPYYENFPGKPEEPVYPGCGSEIQGISIGWDDSYTADISGQELDITGLPDGIYAFRSNVDPENRVVEKDEDNNDSISYVEISGRNVKIVSAPRP